MRRRIRKAFFKFTNYLKENRFAEILIELSLFTPLFFLPSLREISTFRYGWPLDFFSQITNWTYSTVYIIWVVIIGGIASVCLLIRHPVLLKIYLFLSALRLTSLLVPEFWKQLNQTFRYIFDSLLIFPLRLIVPVLIVFLAMSVLGGLNSTNSGSSGDRELQAWQAEADRHKQKTGRDDYFG